jgi:hypothetical protein
MPVKTVEDKTYLKVGAYEVAIAFLSSEDDLIHPW